jgi:hypothetical protein
MTAKFLNDRLVASKRFSPGSSQQTDRPKGEAAAATESGAKADDLKHILDTEDRHTRNAVMARDLAETRKHRREVAAMLADMTESLMQEQAMLTEQARLFRELRQKLEEIGDHFTAEELRPVKRTVEEASLELSRFVRDRRGGAGDPAPDRPLPLATLSWGQATCLGIALTWPLITAVLLGTAVLAWILYSLFGGVAG